ncbi:uncharacterized protein LY89DRAFT_737726 [Mollisia scopiformis]|uniref:Uncharacterized protein n=1 Tax=Mollisia scopiformis TaxID=149040 RepID=A0A194WXX2_MOLSC|nr:uncharacterized protein LY89DRAFT_737726 [Mollisia scopiformis]KUJ12818.1 hypothetical protein LY89DRAFT_737726 [Mollisia scopiformis]
MPSITHLTSAISHATFTSAAETKGTPSYEDLASRYRNIAFAQMDYGPETSMLFKFAPNQLPMLKLMYRDKNGGMWARTVMGADLRELKAGIDEMLEKAGLEE